jgi:hypothetical protein
LADKENSPPKSPEVVDPFNVQTLFVDWIVTGGTHDNIFNVTLGTLDYSLTPPGETLARVVIAARLRCTRAFAQNLHAALGNLLGITPQQGGESANEPPPIPPGIRLN